MVIINHIKRRKNSLNINLTAVFEKSPFGYIGYVEELPGANTQGATLEEAKSNLLEAVQLVLESNRQLAEEQNKGKEIIKEQFGILTALSEKI